MGRLEGKVAVISGAAQGIGACTAEIFVNEGAKVVIADLNEKAGTELAEKLNATGNNAAFFRLNVTDYECWKACMEFTKKTFGKITTLINNAGISYRKDVAGTTFSSRDTIIRLTCSSRTL